MTTEPGTVVMYTVHLGGHRRARVIVPHDITDREVACLSASVASFASSRRKILRDMAQEGQDAGMLDDSDPTQRTAQDDEDARIRAAEYDAGYKLENEANRGR